MYQLFVKKFVGQPYSTRTRMRCFNLNPSDPLPTHHLVENNNFSEEHKVFLSFLKHHQSQSRGLFNC